MYEKHSCLVIAMDLNASSSLKTEIEGTFAFYLLSLQSPTKSHTSSTCVPGQLPHKGADKVA